MDGYQEIICADDDEIISDLLHWANLTELWNENSDTLDRYDLINDILEECDGVFVDREEWDANFPGRSGVMHTIFAADSEALKIELREVIERLIATDNNAENVKVSQTSPVSSYSARKISMKDSEEMAAKFGFVAAPPDHPIYSEGPSITFAHNAKIFQVPEGKENEEVQINSRAYWFKVVDFLQQNWALIENGSSGCKVFFLNDTSGVFDKLEFQSEEEAVDSLFANRFQRYEDSSDAQRMMAPPKEPFHWKAHPNGPIYSSGRFWKNS